MNRSGTIGNNPNFANTMFNPVNPGILGLYNQFERKDISAIDKVRTLAQLEKRVNSFIEVKIVYYDQEGIFRTDSVDSIHPDYNHQFEYIIKPKDGAKYFTREELSKCPGLFYFTLYDEIKRESLIKEKDANTFIQRFEKKYLGSFSIPFATVFQNASILDTICKVDIPKTVFGYYSDITATFDVTENDKMGGERANERNLSQSSGGRGLGNLLGVFANTNQEENIEVPRIVNPFINTYVSLYITLDPIPDFTKNDDLDYVPGFEDSIFLINGTKWLKKMKEKSILKNRTIRLFAENFDGLSVFMPRFLKPDGQPPPQLLFNEQDPNAIEKAARFVALIPFIEDNQTWDYAEEMPDCWCTDNEFITLGFGDYEEHAVLLCNYFNYIDKKKDSKCISYLVLGDAHPEGSTIYVMRQSLETNEVEFWNAKTGDCFYFDKTIKETKCLCITVNQEYKYTKSQTNTICQLKSIGAIITFDNVYINIQNESDPGLIELDIKNRSKWTPFLTEESMKKYFPNGVKTVQKPLEYTESSEEGGLQLKDLIRDYLKKAIETVRGELNSVDRPLRTNWEMTATSKIEKILEKYDMFCFNTNISGINYAKAHQNVLEDKKNEQNDMVKKLLEYEKEIKDEFVGVSEIYGFPINLAYTTMKEIWEQIKLTSVHLIADENCELCLSVYVNTLPANVNSVWIFFAILKKGM
jgi:coiled-coil and C2 domain-containing protein 2A